MSVNSFLGGVKSDFALLFSSVFLSIFAVAIIYLFSRADFSNVVITGSISVEMLMGAFIGIVIAVVGFLGITKGRVETKPS